MLGAPTSLASTMAIGPHHAAVTHVGDSSEVGQREHMVRQGFTRKCWSELLCLGGYLAPPRQVGGFAPRDALGRHPSADPRRWRPAAGGPVAGAQLGIHMLTMWDLARSHLVNGNIAGQRLVTSTILCFDRLVKCSSACVRGEVGATDHTLRSAWPLTTRMAVGSSNGRS
jgi:hypothetical protein